MPNKYVYALIFPLVEGKLPLEISGNSFPGGQMQITFFLIPCRSGISETSMAKRKVVMETLKELQKYRREITSVDYGSVLFRMVCPTLSALLDLRHLCTSGRLAALVEKIFTINDFRERKLRKVHVSVTFDPMEFDLCKEELKDAGKFFYL